VVDIAALHNTIYISGKFSAVGNQLVTNMAALHPESGDAFSWHPKPDGYVVKIVPWGDSTLIFSGQFETTSPLHPEIASVSTNSDKITLWNVDLNDIDPYDNGYEYGSLQSIFPTGKTIYLGGMFRTINGYVVSCGFAALGERPEAATNSIKGNIFNDANADCVKDATEATMPNIIVVAQPGGFYASTDSLGNYKLVVPCGKYQVSQILPQLKGFDVSQLCPNSPSYSIEFSGKNEIIADKDFANKANIQPFLSVDIASDRRRRCFRNQTTVSYQNEGFVPTAGVEIKVEYPDYVIPLSSSIPWKSRQGNTLIFDLGTLMAHSTGQITITDSVTCGDESIRGLSQCTKAFITPRNQIPASSQWDQSSLALVARCKENGFVGLVIKNIGNGNMADSTDYRIFLDATLVFTAKCKLNKNDSLTLEVPVNGRTIRLEADQVAYYPTDSKPSITLEGCGSSSTPISKGYVDQLPQDDAEPEVAISCMPILDSYDPNDKSASPAGVTASHIIRKEDILEYTIRFQNTGNDVAYTVVIEDELSEYLELSTLQMGASSHPCTWKLGGEGKAKLTWTFNNINLPDSSTNEPGSHGFVQFSIAQKKDNALGSTIANQAYITFDYNSPIVTNLVTQTVGEVPEATQRIVATICDGTLPEQAIAGANIQLNNITTIRLQATAPTKDYGRWKLISGAGNIANSIDPQTLVSDLGIGKNIFEWSVYLCDQQTNSRVTIERIVIPSTPLVQAPAAYCQQEVIRLLTARGENVEWFADQQLTQLLGTGETYQPVISRTDTFYVTQTQYGYQSNAQPVVVYINTKPSPPVVPQVVYYCASDRSITLLAEGENIEWYADKQLSKKIGSGSPFTTSLVKDTMVYAIQRVNGCTGSASAVNVKAGAFTPKEVDIPNVITPNGDEKNESFIAPQLSDDSCLGDFRSVQIYNRYGKKIFESTDNSFNWNGAGVSSGVYYYVLSYAAYTYSGTLSILY
jgi:gliding motility-associated-like protein/fimbrial isopeptide formation D2 family protein